MALTTSTEVRPSTAEELAEALHAADQAGQAVTPQGGGTHMELGMPPTRQDVIVHTTGLNRVVEYEPADLTVTVEAGMRYSDMQALLQEQGQHLALDPSVDAQATIGGVIATNLSGPLRFGFGTARDLVIGTRVANADGTLTRAGGRVVKNVAGYDLNKLYIGSLGTLGIIVELSFKLAPIPPATATVVGRFESLDGVRAIVSNVLHSPLTPLAIEVLGPGAAQAVGAGGGVLLVMRLGGYEASVERQARDLDALMGQYGGTRQEVPDTLWDDLAELRRARHPMLVKATAPIAESTTLVDLLERDLAELEPHVWSHAGSGVAFAACDAPADSGVLARLRQRVTGLGDNSALVVERCPTSLKDDFDVWGDPGPSVALMRAIKAKLDPRNTLNPGRYVGGI